MSPLFCVLVKKKIREPLSMPSLKSQLQHLQTPVSRSLGVEREHASLLFDRKEAASFSSEEFYQLGITGLQQLRKVDRSLGDSEYKLFDASSITMNRAMLSKDENDELNKSLDRMIVYLAPYFNHQGCKQVLEWLIHKHHIHLYNGPTVANAFLLYHSTNSFGRLVRVLKIKDRPEWEFVNEFSTEALPIPFSSILKACLKGGANHFLIASYSSFLQQAIQLVGDEYASGKMQAHFTFFASLVVHLFEDTANITEQLISRIIPIVGAALKSKVLPFKMAGFMIICDLVMNTTLNEETLMNILNLSMLKMRSEWFEVAMNVILVICQHQNIKSLPKKAFVKLIRKGDSLGLSHYLSDAVDKLDLTGFVLPLVNTAFECLTEGDDADLQNTIVSYIKLTSKLESMNELQASAVVRACFEHILAREDGQIPKDLHLLLKQIVLRFAPTFDAIRAEMMITNNEALARFLDQCEIAEHEIGILSFEDKKKRRLRSDHSRNYENETIQDESASKEVPGDPKILKTEDKLRNLQEDVDVQKTFKKPPSVILEMLNSGEPIKKLEWALQSFNSSKYLARQLPDDLENFVLATIRFISKNPQSPYKSALKSTLFKLKIPETTQLPLILPYREESSAKRGRYSKISSDPMQEFAEETDQEFEARLTFVLDLYNASPTFVATPALVHQLFEMINIVDNPTKNYSSIKKPLHIQQSTLLLICKILAGQEVKSLIDRQVELDPLVSVIQFTHDSAVLRNALKVLTYVAPLVPTQLTRQIMSLFTFMGNGLLKKDNELTLMIVEETLHALLSAILTAAAKKPVQYQNQLVEVSKIFAKSLPDIPAHRHSRVLKTLTGCVQPEYTWIIFAAVFEEICAQWKKPVGNEQGNDDNLSDTCLEFIGTLEPEQQIRMFLDLLEYVVSLGGDAANERVPAAANVKRFPLIFDGKSHPNQKLHHYRYKVVVFVSKMLKQPALYTQLAELDDDDAIYEQISLLGKRMVNVLISLEEFVSKEVSVAEKNKSQARKAPDPSAPSQFKPLKYWVELKKRANNIVTRLCELLPADVRTQIVLNLETEEEFQIRASKMLRVELTSNSSTEPVDDDDE